MQFDRSAMLGVASAVTIVLYAVVYRAARALDEAARSDQRLESDGDHAARVWRWSIVSACLLALAVALAALSPAHRRISR